MPTTATLTPVDERVELTFAKRQGTHTTHWIEITYPSDARPEAMLADLAAAGFVEDGMNMHIPLPVYKTVDGKYVRQGYSEILIHLTSPGTGLFGEWTAQDKTAKITAARRVLRAYGFVRVPIWDKTLADML